MFLLQAISLSPHSLTINECDSCHGPSHLGHVSYTVSLGISQTILNGTTSTLSATIVNSNYPLSQSSITLRETADYKFKPLITSDTTNKVLGTLGRGSTTIASWTIIPNVNTNKSITLQVDFTGTASNHKVFTYSSSFTKSIFVSTAKIALLQVQSNPLSDTTYLLGQSTGNNSLTVQNTGVIDMNNVSVSTSGNVLVNGTKNFTITSITSGTQVNYPIEIDTSKQGTGTITILYAGSNPVQSVTIAITVSPPPPVSILKIIGDILGYLTFALLFLSVVAGAGVYHLKKYISGRKIRILHADLSNLSFTVAVIHAVILSLPSSPWFGTYSLFEIVPQLLPTFATTQDFGLELGRWALLLMYIGVISGYFIAKIMKKFSRRVGISIHMLTYIALIFGLIHTMVIGSFAKSFVIIPIIMFVSIISIGLLKYDIKMRMAKKKAERAKKMKKLESKSKTEAKTKKTKPLYISSRKALASSGISCQTCSTINDNDASFCKRCGNHLPGKFCIYCETRNQISATTCIACKKKLDY